MCIYQLIKNPYFCNFLFAGTYKLSATTTVIKYVLSLKTLKMFYLSYRILGMAEILLLFCSKVRMLS